MNASTDVVKAVRAAWGDGVTASLTNRFGRDRADTITERWLPGVPDDFVLRNQPTHAATVLRAVVDVLAADRDCGAVAGADDGTAFLVIVRRGRRLQLSRSMSLLADLGLEVREEHASRLAAIDEVLRFPPVDRRLGQLHICTDSSHRATSAQQLDHPPPEL